ncbi:hypothetical protein S83_058047 [Arachis hypogaea]
MFMKILKENLIKKVKKKLKEFGDCILPLQLEEASKGIALIPNLPSLLLFLIEMIWDHAIPLDSSFGSFYYPWFHSSQLIFCIHITPTQTKFSILPFCSIDPIPVS